MRCAVAIDLPADVTGRVSPVVAAGSGGDLLRHWLVGTEDDKLHLLRARGESPRELNTVVAGGVRLSTGAASAKDMTAAAEGVADDALGIRAVTLVFPEKEEKEKEKEQPPPLFHEHSAVCVGFADGSLRQYPLKRLIEMFLPTP